MSSQPLQPDQPAFTMDIVEIMSILPHRYPFLLIDRIVEMERKTRIVASRTSPSTSPTSPATSPTTPSCPAS
jgi:3-hydroxyacyl-[acyl-carrier-protein] dehydratase